MKFPQQYYLKGISPMFLNNIGEYIIQILIIFILALVLKCMKFEGNKKRFNWKNFLIIIKHKLMWNGSIFIYLVYYSNISVYIWMQLRFF